MTYERHHAMPDGSDRYDQVTLVVRTDIHGGGPVVYSFGVDITDRKRAEQQLRETGDQLGRATRMLQLTLHIPRASSAWMPMAGSTCTTSGCWSCWSFQSHCWGRNLVLRRCGAFPA